jgi:hypothetical protein
LRALAKTIGQQIGVHCRAKKLALLEPSTRQASSRNSPSRLRPGIGGMKDNIP